MPQYEVWTGNRYLFTCAIGEDPWEACANVYHARVVEVSGRQRREL